MKEQVVSNQNQIDFISCDEVIVKICLEYYQECWKRRCVVLHEQEVKRKILRENAVAIEKEANKGEI